jgi:hypothetical protein
MSDTLAMFVIYDRPSDYPTKVVVRKWFVREQPEPNPCQLFDSLQEARPRWLTGRRRLFLVSFFNRRESHTWWKRSARGCRSTAGGT